MLRVYQLVSVINEGLRLLLLIIPMTTFHLAKNLLTLATDLLLFVLSGYLFDLVVHQILQHTRKEITKDASSRLVTL